MICKIKGVSDYDYFVYLCKRGTKRTSAITSYNSTR